MNRLCIYMTYNKDNKIHEYIGNALKSLKECCSTVCLVCNYDGIREGREYAEVYADSIFYRENNGYDAGAFKDTLCNFLGWNEVRKYDEIILTNDSFFGFFYPLQDTFQLMDKEECDFWGITGQEAGEYRNPTYEFDAYIHSYFLTFRKNIITSEAFRSFWEELEYPRNFREAIENFELGINSWLKNCGFKGKSYIDIYHIPLIRNENPYYSMPYELIQNYRVPILKKKSLLIRTVGFESTLRALNYLKQEGIYPVDWIIPYLENQFYIPGMGTETCNSLEIFYRSHADIYIYGAGVCGKSLDTYFAYKGWKHRGFIVTDSSNTELDAITIDGIEIRQNTGIIISVIDEKITEEIVQHIGNRCSREQLFYISDCSAIILPR